MLPGLEKDNSRINKVVLVKTDIHECQFFFITCAFPDVKIIMQASIKVFKYHIDH